MRRNSLVHEFIDDIPARLEDGKLYVSIRYRTAVHLCACGCGNKIVTPIKPAKWHLTFDGTTVSLTPSIGSWQFACRSHYWIRKNMVCWAKPWTDEQVHEGRESDARELRAYLESRRATEEERTTTAAALDSGGMFSRVRQWLTSRRR